MEVTMDTIVGAMILIATAAGWIYREIQHRGKESEFEKVKANALEVVKDSSDALAFIYSAANKGDCSPETMLSIAEKTGEVWSDLTTLGPKVAELMELKSGLAETLNELKK